MKFLDLFSGIGGFRLGLQRAGHEPVGWVEIDKFARQSYQAMYDTTGEWTATDINKVTDEEWREFNGTVELITGGFPCQSFSIAGKREGFLNKTKGTLFFEVARAVKQIKPRFVFLENVKGLLSSNTTIDYIDAVRIVNNDLKEHKELWETKRPLVLKQWKELDDNLTNILLKKFVSENIFQKAQLDILSKKELEFHSEQLGTKAEAGLMKNLQYCVTQVLQTMKKSRNFQNVLAQVSDKHGEDITSSLNQLSSLESLRTTDIPTLEKMASMFVEIDWLLNKPSGENSEKTKLFTTSMDEKQTTDPKIYSFVTELPTLVYIIRQWKLLQHSWKKALLLLTEKKESTFYAKTFKIILSVLDELGYDVQWRVLNSKNFGVPQNRERVYIVGHLRGDSGREVFSIFGENGETNHTNVKQIGNISNSNSFGGNPQTGRVYADDGLSPTLNTMQGGGREPKVMVKEATQKGYDVATVGDSINISQPNSKTRRGRVGHSIANTLVTGSEQATLTSEYRIRKLTPRETWRLQAFPDELFDKAQQAGLSDSQLYKQAGNSVTVNVIEYIGKMIEMGY